MTELIKLMEIIGTVAFALSGSLVAISSGLDIFGVAFLACITAFGGGIVRDTLLGINPPAIFSGFPIFILAMVVAVLTFVIAYIFRSKFVSFKAKLEAVNNIFDAIGLSAFVVIGSEVACLNGFEDNGLIVVFCGMITGIGGGIFRDVLIDTTPYVFKKHIYAVATIVGGIVYFVLKKYVHSIHVSSIVSMSLIFVIRIMATKFRWSLPKIQINK